ncbi:hypothetical protein V2H45_09435 [Tumidithrix elongata RA019]|uniref:Isopropylmalate/homocitrate/citramalate synthases n=1 Tax=Tumidithrix elongata BACA0141 TaxID=2716417 RepID=A0AAW9PVY6_9CYAN|nr:hypothetical protein [Tumidithrix elongata RA019]
MMNKSDFMNPRSRFYGEFTPQNLMFDANLQEFAHRVSIVTALTTGGKLMPEEAYSQIKKLWHELKNSKRELGIGKKPTEGTQGMEN